MSPAAPARTTEGGGASAAPPVLAESAVEGLPPGFGEGLAGKAAFGIAVAFSMFQLVTAAYAVLPSQVVRAMHVGFLLLLLAHGASPAGSI